MRTSSSSPFSFLLRGVSSAVALPRLLVRSATAALIAGLLCAATGSATAQTVIIGNLAGVSGGLAGQGDPLSRSLWEAASFTMGNQAYTVTDVQIRLAGARSFTPPASYNPGASTTFQIRTPYQGSSPASSVLLFTFDTPVFSDANATTYTFTAGSSFTLEANTTYFLTGLTQSLSDSSYWAFGNGTATGPGATLNIGSNSQTAGFHWTNGTGNIGFQIDGIAIPEPGTYAAFAGAAALLFVGYQRVKNRRQPVTPPANA